MPAYVVADVNVHDPENFEEYKKTVGPTIEEFGGKFLIRGGKLETLEGNWTPARLVVLEFPSMEKAKAWWNSPSYAGPKAIRLACAESTLLLAEGV
jgi:uncharacterized protein (DUF1330 family)